MDIILKALFLVLLLICFITIYDCSEESTTQSQSLSEIQAPTNLSFLSLSASEVLITWKDNSSTETGFIVERGCENFQFTELATLKANVTSFKDDQLSSENQYCYRIKTIKDNNQSEYSDTLIISYSIDSAVLVSTLDGETIKVKSVAFNNAQNILACGGCNNKIILWDLNNFAKSNEILWDTLQSYHHLINALTFDSNDELLITGGQSSENPGGVGGIYPNRIKIFDLNSGEMLAQTTERFTNIFHIKYLPQSNSIISRTWDGLGKWQYNSADNSLTNVWFKSIDITDDLEPLDLSEDGNEIVVDDNNDINIEIYNSVSGSINRSFFGHNGQISGLSFSPQDRYLISSGTANQIKIYNYETEQVLQTIEAHSNVVLNVLSCNKSYIFFSIAADDKIKAWDIHGFVIRDLSEVNFVPLCMAISNDDRYLAVGGYANYNLGLVKVWKLDYSWVSRN